MAASDAPDDDRRFILELLTSTRERHERAFPGAEHDAFVYFAHLSAVRQLTELYYRRLLRPHRISYSEYRVISGLRIRGKGFRATPQELLRFTQITSAGMTRTLDRLEQAGHVERTPNPEDRRSILIGLTRSGWELADTLTRDFGERFREALGPADAGALDAEIEQLGVVVERLVRAVIR